jgi:hypothetical protein
MSGIRKPAKKVIDGKKICNQCGKNKLVPEEFPMRKYIRKDGSISEYPRHRCKTCEQEYNRKYQYGNTVVHDTRRITRAVTGKTKNPRGPDRKYRKPRARTMSVDATEFFEFFDSLHADQRRLFLNIGEDSSQLRVARKSNRISPRLADKVLTALGQQHMMKVLGIE